MVIWFSLLALNYFNEAPKRCKIDSFKQSLEEFIKGKRLLPMKMFFCLLTKKDM